MEWTTLKVKQLKELAGKKKAEDIAKELGATVKAIRKQAYKLKISLRVPVIHEYCLYKGDEMLFMGTLPEIAAHWGVSEHTIRHYATQHYKKRIGEKKNRVVVEKII